LLLNNKVLEITRKSWSMGGGERSKDEDWAEIE